MSRSIFSVLNRMKGNLKNENVGREEIPLVWELLYGTVEITYEAPNISLCFVSFQSSSNSFVSSCSDL